VIFGYVMHETVNSHFGCHYSELDLVNLHQLMMLKSVLMVYTPFGGFNYVRLQASIDTRLPFH